MSDIPPDFDKPWDMADVVLHAQNSDGKPLHVSKSVLAVFSPYFRALFFGGFKEKDQKEFDVDCDYSTLLEILQLLHHVNRNFGRFGEKQYPADSIIKIYTIADRFDFPLVRKMCEEQMVSSPVLKMAEAALSLGLRDILMKIMTLSTSKTVEAIMSTEDSKPLFSKKDVLLFYKLAVSRPLPMEGTATEESLCLNLEKIVEESKDPRIDLTKPWRSGDVVIFTNNSLGRVLYANKTVMEIVCSNFEAKLSPFQEQELKLENIPEGVIKPQYQVNFNMEFTTMKQILSIVHHCDMNLRGRGSILHPALLFDMYRETDEELEIPMIRKMCLDQLIDNPCPAALDVALTLDVIDEVKESLLSAISEDDLRFWLVNDKKLISYMSGGKEMVLTTTPNEALLSMKNVHFIVGKLRRKFSSGIPVPDNKIVFKFGQ